MASPFDRPIPGSSLTSPKGKYPYEQPPEMTEVKDVFNFYMEKVADDETIDDFAMICEMGVPLKPIVRSIITSQQMKGKHSIDTGLMVAPILHEFLKQAIEATGVTVKDDDRDYKKEAEQRELQKFKALTMKYIKDIEDQNDPGVELLKEIAEPEATTETAPEEAKPMGLMAKG
tara:strand:+ start:43 stop:564 length:522 start_codon:yes stop_codon:yes gene_type:complete